MPQEKPKPARHHRKKPIQPPPRQHQLKPVSQPRQIQRERILSQLHDLIVACEELFDEHGTECDCETCSVVSNFVGALRLFCMVLKIS
jgi:hypothetical protein